MSRNILALSSKSTLNPITSHHFQCYTPIQPTVFLSGHHHCLSLWPLRRPSSCNSILLLPPPFPMIYSQHMNGITCLTRISVITSLLSTELGCSSHLTQSEGAVPIAVLGPFPSCPLFLSDLLFSPPSSAPAHLSFLVLNALGSPLS